MTSNIVLRESGNLPDVSVLKRIVAVTVEATASSDKIICNLGRFRVESRPEIAEKIQHKIGQGVELLLQEKFSNKEWNESEALLFVKKILENLMTDEDFFKAFCEYFAGLRWASDKDRFVHALFTHGASYDKETLEKHLQVYQLHMLHREAINTSDVAAFFSKFPELDYHQLEDSEFADSPYGIALKRIYEKQCGKINARQYSDIETEEKPLIPLSKFPLVEAIISSEIGEYKQQAKYSFGPTDWISEIWDSDSNKVQKALAAQACTRSERGDRYVFDGPSEFQYKGHIISELSKKYLRNNQGAEAQKRLAARLMEILDGYILTGRIAASVRSELKSTNASDETKEDKKNAQEISSEILSILLAGSEEEGRKYAEIAIVSHNFIQIIRTMIHMVDRRGAIVKKGADSNPEAIDQEEDQKIMLLNALMNVGKNSDPKIFGRMGMYVFDLRDSRELEGLAEQAISLRQNPPTENSRAQWNEVYMAYIQRLNRYLLKQLQDSISKNNTHSPIVPYDIDKISFSDDFTEHEEYQGLVLEAKSGRMLPDNKSKVISKIAENAKYKTEGATQEQVISDILEIYFGPEAASTEEMLNSTNGMYGYIGINSMLENRREAFSMQLSTKVRCYMAKIDKAIEVLKRGKSTEENGDLRRLEHVRQVLSELMIRSIRAALT